MKFNDPYYHDPYYKEINLNPKGNKVGDCVIRAIANAEGRTWYEVFDDLVKLARKNCFIPNDKKNYKTYLKLKGYKKIGVKYDDIEGRQRRLTPRDFHGMHDQEGHDLAWGTYLVAQANHLTVVKDGVTEDSWDCSNRAAYIIWKVK